MACILTKPYQNGWGSTVTATMAACCASLIACWRSLITWFSSLLCCLKAKPCISRRRRNIDRQRQERTEKEAAQETVHHFCNRQDIKDVYRLFVGGNHSANIGGRLQKYWFFLNDVNPKEACTEDEDFQIIKLQCPHALLSISPVSANCPLHLDTSTMKTLNSILTKVKEHSYLHTVHGIWHLPDTGRGKGQVIVIQDFHEVGSLRDYIHKERPYNENRGESFLTSWSKKYSNEGTSIEVEKIAMFGGQILQAIKFLYKSGFQTLGHVHVGNVFICEDQDGQKMCKLGGYDQTLLGYRSRLYRDILRMNLLEHIDVIMFGHVVFEMGSGTELSGVIPTQEEYDKVTDHTVRDVLQYIFENLDFKKIRNHWFFKDASRKIKIECKVSPEEKAMLTAVNAPYAVESNVTSWIRTKVINFFSSSTGEGSGIRRTTGKTSKTPTETDPLLAEHV